MLHLARPTPMYIPSHTNWLSDKIKKGLIEWAKKFFELQLHNKKKTR